MHARLSINNRRVNYRRFQSGFLRKHAIAVYRVRNGYKVRGMGLRAV